MLQQLPRDVRVIARKLRDGELTVRWSPGGEAFERMVRQRSRASNRLAAAVTIVGLAGVSSFLFIGVANTPAFHGVEGALTPAGHTLLILGVLGYLMAAFLGLGFFWGMFRSGGQS